MMGLIDEFEKVREQRDGLERQRARREADLDLATQRRDEALAELKDRFGCETVADAERLLAEMREEIARDIASVEQALDGVLDDGG